MRVLIACEYSGTVRDAFIAHGHEAISCDLLPTDKPGPHYRKWAVVHNMAPGPDRWKLRSTTYAGIADAMANQWGRVA
jgi:hypothetical protein